MKPLSEIDLAVLIDENHNSNNLFVTETEEEVILNNVQASIGRTIVDYLRTLGWKVKLENNAEIIDAEIDEALSPYRITFTKPQHNGYQLALTESGFRTFISNPNSVCISYARCKTKFSTLLYTVTPWMINEIVHSSKKLKSPRLFSRDLGTSNIVPEDIRPWIIADEQYDFDDFAFSVCSKIAIRNIFYSIVDECHSDLTLHVKRKANLVIDANKDFEFNYNNFVSIMECTNWIFESTDQTETKHGLFANEISAIGRQGTQSIQSCIDYFQVAFSSARISFNYSLQKVSAETTKSLSELRKNISEESSKLSDMSRSIANSIAAATFVGIGLIGARLTTDTNKWVILAMSICIFIYIIGVSIFNNINMKLQMKIRSRWRYKLYPFIDDNDYNSLVKSIAQEAERNVVHATYAGYACAFLIFISALGLAVTHP